MQPPLRVAIIGAGPAGLYALEHLLEKRGLDVEVDLFERLPTPWGLVRAGVAPDHPEKKQVIDRLFDFYLKNPRVRFIGNVEIGVDIAHSELAAWYDAVIYALGAASDTRMGIPGEALPGCLGAREFVGFYNGHPDYSGLRLDLSGARAVVVGNGNVALDVARILTMPLAGLERTDIADHALVALRASAVRDVVVLGRRGPAQAAYNNPELEELADLAGVDVVVEPGDDAAVLDVAMRDAALPEAARWETRRKMESLRRMAGRARKAGNKRIVLRFLSSPVELRGRGRVEQVVIGRNELAADRDGRIGTRPTGLTTRLDAGLVFRAIGYRGTPFPGLPFDAGRGVIRNLQGRVCGDAGVISGVYVTGWIKRGCRGVIGSNKKCAHETVQWLFDDMQAGRLKPGRLDKAAALAVVVARKPDAVLLGGWLRIDHVERTLGRAAGRPRVKVTDGAALLKHAHALAEI